MRNKIFSVVAVCLSFSVQLSCAQHNTQGNGSPAGGFVKIGQLPGQVKESSGLAPANQPKTYYTQGDAGTGPVLFKVSTDAKLLETIRLPVSNKDWESLAHDSNGNLYVCDCGNNSNKRKDLVIYRLNPQNPQQVAEIKFSYPDQNRFPPRKKKRNFDSEASFWHNGNVYLFSRDRGRRQTSKVYKVPAEPGSHQAQLLTSLPVPGEVTGASLSPNGKRMALLTKQHIFVYEADTFDGLLKAEPRQLSNNGAGQTEGVDFLDDNTLLISTEEGGLFTQAL